MKNIKEITDIFKQEIKKKYTSQIAMPIYMGVRDMEIVLEEIERLQNIINEVKEYITSYESISTIQGLEDIEANKDLDEKTLNEMVRRYMIVHDKLIDILNKEKE